MKYHPSEACPTHRSPASQQPFRHDACGPDPIIEYSHGGACGTVAAE